MSDPAPASEEQQKACELLENPRIFEIITEQEFDKKVVGEIENRKAIFLLACGAFVENHNLTSYNLCVNSNSGAGKDFVVSNILKIFPKEIIERRTRISPNAFTYWHNSKFEPDWDWNGKICYLQDVSNSILNCDVFKVMCSEGSYSTVVKDQRAIDIEIKGKPVMFITTAHARPNNEILRRFPILYLNETVDQTRAIIKRHAELAKIGKTSDYLPEITKMLSFLKCVKVKIPFADSLTDFPDQHIIIRTHFGRMLDLIKASAALYQYQRKRDNEGYIIAEMQDYERAMIALRQITQNILMIPFTKKQEKLINLCKKEFAERWFAVKDVVKKCNFLSESKIYEALDDLQEDFFDIDTMETENVRKPIKIYKVKSLLITPLFPNVNDNSHLLLNNSLNSPSLSPLKQQLINGELREEEKEREIGELRELIHKFILNYLKENKKETYFELEATWLKQRNIDILNGEFDTFYAVFSKLKHDGIIAEQPDGIIIPILKGM